VKYTVARTNIRTAQHTQGKQGASASLHAAASVGLHAPAESAGLHAAATPAGLHAAVTRTKQIQVCGQVHDWEPLRRQACAAEASPSITGHQNEAGLCGRHPHPSQATKRRRKTQTLSKDLDNALELWSPDVVNAYAAGSITCEENEATQKDTAAKKRR